MARTLRKWPKVHLLEYEEYSSYMMPSPSIFHEEKKKILYLFLQNNNSTYSEAVR